MTILSLSQRVGVEKLGCLALHNTTAGTTYLSSQYLQLPIIIQEVLKMYGRSKSPEGLTSKVSNSVCLGGAKLYISNEISGDADVAGPRTTY